MPRPQGGYAYVEHWPTRRGPVFVVTAVTNVRDRFKRLFPGHKQLADTGQLLISGTDANARDLAWFLQRHRLEPLDEQSAKQVRVMAERHLDGEEQLGRILDGDIPDLFLGREPVPGRELAVDPRDYQLVPPAIVRARGFLLLADDLGLGKTLEASLLFTDPEALPALVVCPTHLVDQWAYEELPKYFPWIRTHVARRGTPYVLEEHRSCKGQKPHVLVMTYGMLYGWADRLAGEIRTVIFDEGDELRTGDETRKYAGALRVARHARYRMLMTATPVHNWADDIWNLADLLQEGVLGTKDEFRLQRGGKRVHNPRGLGQDLREQGVILRRTKADVGRELPECSQMIYPVETDKDLLKREMDGIIAMAVKVLDTSTDRTERFNTAGQLDHKIRRATGVAKAPYVAALVRLILQQQQKIVLVGHHHDVYDIWAKELADFNPVFYTGLQSKNQKAESKKAFIHGDARVFVMAVRSGSGLNGLQYVANTMVFGEVDWSPARHKQIIGREHRDGQTQPVSVIFAMSDAGSDPAIADLIELKRRIGEPITDPDAEVVEPSADEAQRRVKALAAAVLRQHGVAVPKHGQIMPTPQPATGELFTRQVADPAGAAVAAAAVRADQTRILEGTATDTTTPHTRDDLRGRLTATRS